MFKILDCTLRDGGYINNWEFGYENIKNYLDCMTDSDADYIEAGFLVDKAVNQNQSLYNKTEDVPIASDKITLMIAYGKYNVVSLPESSISSVKNMRYIFKHKEISHALYEVSVLKQKGYKLFINPTFISVYDNKEILNLIKKVNEIMPFCFTIVDSMGVLNKTRFVSIFNMVNDCLNPDISIGIHLHNNLNYINENINALSDIKTDMVAQMGKDPPAMQYTQVRSLGREDPLEKEMAIHSITIAWKIPWTEKPGRLQSMGLQRVRHD